MNKKLFLGMFAAAGMLFATSCSNDELDVQSGNEAQVSFSLGLEGGIATRAISDGQSAKTLVCAVYDANETLLDKVVINDKQVDANGQYVNTDAFKGGLTDNVRITLAKGQTYTIAFWAQNGDCDAYDTDDLKAVKVDYTNGAEGESATGDINNDDTRDAFFAAETFKVEGNKEIEVTLKRPFAQINVGVTAEDWEAAIASNIEIEKSAVVINNVADEINLLTGAVKASDAMANGITYTLGGIPNEPLYVETDATKEGKEEYVWLSMSYILVDDGSESAASVDGAQKSTLNGLKYTFAPENGKGQPIEFAEGLAGAPVQRNWRTNILGKILTGDIQFNITIDPVYDGDYIYPNSKDEELEFATTFGGTYKMTEDKNLTQSLDVNADFILEGQNNTMNITNASNYGIRVHKGTTVLKDVIITSDNGGVGAVGGAAIIFDGGSLNVTTTNTNPRYNFYAEGTGSTITIKEGNFDISKTTLKRAYACANNGATIYIEGGTFGKASTRYNGSGFREVEGGQVIVKGGTFGFDPTEYLADGYATIKEGDSYKVVPQIVASLANVTENTTVELKNDVTVSTGTTIQTKNATANITINGNGNSIVSTANSGDDFQWLDNSTTPTMSTILSSSTSQRTTITVNDLNFEGTISALMLGHYYAHNSNNNDIFLNNVNVINTKVVSFSANVAPAVAIYGTATLEDCNIYGTTRSELETYPMWELCDIAVVNDAVLTMEGGKIGKIIAWAKSKITVDNNAVVECIKPISQTMNTDTKYGVTVKAGATVEVLDLSNIALDKKKINITIEEGATVGKIIDANGNEYSTLEAFKNAE